MNETFRVNNFDLIRLLAALQVALHHAMFHLKVESQSLLIDLSSLFPGVPIFFFISGFLISRSYECNPDVMAYAQNRALRIYPALIVCTFVAVASVYATGYLREQDVDLRHLAIWIAGQITFVQFYNPSFMRGFGTGVLNGSLWSITVELQFYVALPIVYRALHLAPLKRSNQKLLLLIAAFLLLQIAGNQLGQPHQRDFWFKLYNVSFVPWIYMFLVGVFFQRNFALFHRLFAGRFGLLACAYLAAAYIGFYEFGLDMGNQLNPVLYLLLAALVFSAAYSKPAWGHKLLRGNDVSYGVYIYHIPIVNLLIYGGYVGEPRFVLLTLVAATLLAIVSWLVIERSSLRLKRHSMNPLNRHGQPAGSLR